MHLPSLPEFALATCSCVSLQDAAASVTYPGTAPGIPTPITGRCLYFEQQCPSRFMEGFRHQAGSAGNREQGTAFHGKGRLRPPFLSFVMEGPPAISALKGCAASPQLGERKEGTAISVTFRDKKSGLAVH